jgi:ABC-type multidrug transport system fused ATPase/permease subunit
VLIGISDRIYHSFLKYISWITSSATWPQFGAVGLIVFVTLINAHYSWIPKAQLIPFIYLLSRLTTGLGEVMRGIGSIEFNLPFAKSITDYLNENQELLSVEEVSPENKNNLHLKKIIEVSAQNLSIGRTHPLLKNISFTAKEGDFVWIHGSKETKGTFKI